jgi:hypothetical protein
LELVDEGLVGPGDAQQPDSVLVHDEVDRASAQGTDAGRNAERSNSTSA